MKAPKPAAGKRELDAYTLRRVARWHRERFRKSTFPSAWEAHLISYKRFRDKARALESPTKPKATRKARVKR